tara:strand:- start:204 stop:371 length:168 start_codon:yes stop_codon:yes gene_type:complete
VELRDIAKTRPTTRAVAQDAIDGGQQTDDHHEHHSQEVSGDQTRGTSGKSRDFIK